MGLNRGAVISGCGGSTSKCDMKPTNILEQSSRPAPQGIVFDEAL